MRQFEHLLFLGNGAVSAHEAQRLHDRLNEGLSLSGGLQQSNQGEPEDEGERAHLEAELQDVVRDLAAALLGREIAFEERLPY